eukprot:8337344-Lingulodinium_polyedra.AAC.1
MGAARASSRSGGRRSSATPVATQTQPNSNQAPPTSFCDAPPTRPAPGRCARVAADPSIHAKASRGCGAVSPHKRTR